MSVKFYLENLVTPSALAPKTQPILLDFCWD